MNQPSPPRPSALTGLLRWEGLLVCLLTVAFFVSVPLALRSRPGKYVRANEQEITFRLAAE